MKKINLNIFIAAFAVLLFAASCSSVLEEQPRASYDPTFFKTEDGVRSGLTSMYAHLRWIYGQGYYYNITLTGTDEYTWATSADGNFKDADMTSGGTMTPSTSRADVVWNAAFPNINTASGVIENAEAVGLSPALIAEARFFRAFDYFQLVQTFGGVPLDLGGGNLKFNQTTSRTSVRNTVPEVYTIGIFPDLKQAVADLPDAPRLVGTATKTVARLYLAKAYLTYAWWLENPNNIPTYPETPRVDPDGHDAAWYYQQAYNVAVEGIDDTKGNYKLMDTYYQVHVASNDRNKEILLFADHTNASQQYNGGIDFGYQNGEAPDNFAGWMVTPQMENLRSAKIVKKKETGKTDQDSLDTRGIPVLEYSVASVPREAAQWGGRPWTRMAPPIGVFENTFADKTNDSRYDGTFVSVYHANWQKNNSAPVLYNASSLPVYPGNNGIGAVGINLGLGDAILTFLPDESQVVNYGKVISNITQNKDKLDTLYCNSNIGAGIISGRADWVISPRGINRQFYPGLWKIGTYRTDNGTGLGTPNGSTCRPFDIAKFSELYLIAAEAAVKGAATVGGKSARELVNVLRARAGKWSFSNAENAAKVEDNSAALVTATPATIDINYILAERSREFFGEGYRWFDLVRTQKWAEIAGTYEIGNTGTHTPETFTRNIQPFHYLRPIPQAQIDRLDFSAEEKDAYQNPGYK